MPDMTIASNPQRRISRRRFLQAGSFAAAGSALALTGCGGGNSQRAAGKREPVIGPVEQNRLRRFGTGVTAWDPNKTFDGLTVFSPNLGTSAYAIDMEGKVVNQWDIAGPDSSSRVWMVRALENGNLFAFVYEPAGDAPPFVFKGARLQELDWQGKVVWEFADPHAHHDATVLPNGNLLILRAEPVPHDMAARLRGGAPGTEQDTVWTDWVVEATRDGEVVWEWHAWQHLDPSIEVINPPDTRAEWTHANSVFQIPNGDLLISFRNINLVAIVSRTTGDVTWDLRPPTVAQQHHATMLENGHVMIFDNGAHRLDSAVPYSRVIQVEVESKEIVWQHADPTLLNFFSPFISSAQRLANGNTLITEGNFGRIFEVTADHELVWEYVSPYFNVNAVLGENNGIFRAFRYPESALNLA